MPFAATSPHSIRHADVALVAKIVKMPRARRGWIGAAIGAAVVAPFGVSMTGDMMLAGTVVGALIGRGTGPSRAEVVFERQRLP
jgi:hypothetical protein